MSDSTRRALGRFACGDWIGMPATDTESQHPFQQLCTLSRAAPVSVGLAQGAEIGEAGRRLPWHQVQRFNLTVEARGYRGIDKIVPTCQPLCSYSSTTVTPRGNMYTTTGTYYGPASETLAAELISPDATFHVPGRAEPMRGPAGYLAIIQMMREGYLTGKIDARTKLDPKAHLRSGFDRFSPENITANMPIVNLLSQSQRAHAR